MLMEMNAKLTDAIRLYDRLLNDQISRKMVVENSGAAEFSEDFPRDGIYEIQFLAQ
jgi:hypothetical protein